jgi:hypothetical protein
MRAWQRLAGPLPVACQRHAVKSRPALVPVHGMYYYFFLKEVHGMYYYFFLKEVSEQAVGAIATQVHFDRPTV